MPTAARLISALGLAVLAYLVGELVRPLMPEGTNFGYFTPINVCLGLVVGWTVMGKRAGRGLTAGITNGLTGMLALMFWALFVYGSELMFSRAMDNRYGGPFEAIMAIFELGFDYAVTIAVPNVLITLAVGGVLTGLAAEFAAKRYR